MRHNARRRPEVEPAWVRDDDVDLCARRFCDLRLNLADSLLGPQVDRLYAELAARDIEYEPPVYLSSDWFSADGVPAIAMPFYLAHPRLMKLERARRLFVEGGTTADCMRLLRHEAGHAVDTAFRLSRRPGWQKVFGRRSAPYPASYRVDPWSLSHVHHLPQWYAQSHPADDFAETFAVWLTPRSRWRQQYEGWAALDKLEYVDHLLRSVRGMDPRQRSRERPYSLPRLRQTLGDHYSQKRRLRAIGPGQPFDEDLQRMFDEGQRFAPRSGAAAFLRRHAKKIEQHVARETDVPPYSARQVLDDMILRVRELGLQLHGGRRPPTLKSIRQVVARALRRLGRGTQILMR